MIVLGDIHGEVKSYLKLLSRYPGEPSVQLGDFGIGFPDDPPLPELPENAWFFRGNHDNPREAWTSKHYLGDFGFKEIDGHRVFWLSGARSSDQEYRKVDVDWWSGEELPLEDLEEAIALYAETKPDIMLSHDGPDPAVDAIMNSGRWTHKKRYPSRTGQTLTRMLAIHRPNKWIFGHWHTRLREIIEGTEFRCIPPQGWCQIHGEFKRLSLSTSGQVTAPSRR